LFDCALTGQGDARTGGQTCSPAAVDNELNKYFGLGVRHIFPAHLADTAFSGMALYPGPESWNYNNHFLNGKWLDARTDACSHPGIKLNFNVGRDTVISNMLLFLTGPGLQGDPPIYPYPDDASAGHCNEMGLTDLGKFLITDMMSHHMIIDIDHMSMQARDATLNLTGAADPRGYPVIAGHTGFLGIAASNDKKNEAAKTDDELAYMARSGGLAAAGLNAGLSTDVSQAHPSWRQPVNNDCSSSTKTWAQEYLYAVDKLGGPTTAAVAVATDQPLNPFVGPRFGGDGCNGGPSSERDHQLSTSRVTYPITVLNPGMRITLPPAQMGSKKWDFNEDGMAHIGLYPDLIQDLLSIGLTEQDLQPLFRSAEQYIKMWENAERIGTAPTPTPPGGDTVAPSNIGSLGNQIWPPDPIFSWPPSNPDQNLNIPAIIDIINGILLDD